MHKLNELKLSCPDFAAIFRQVCLLPADNKIQRVLHLGSLRNKEGDNTHLVPCVCLLLCSLVPGFQNVKGSVACLHLPCYLYHEKVIYTTGCARPFFEEEDRLESFSAFPVFVLRCCLNPSILTGGRGQLHMVSPPHQK